MLLRLRAAFRKEFVQFFRAKALVFFVIYMFAEIANCGWALSMDVRNLPLTVVDHDQTSDSRALGERFRITPYFDYRRAESGADPEALIASGEATLVLVIPPGFGRDLSRGQEVHVQLIADGTYSNISLLALGYASEILGTYNANLRGEWAFRRADPGLLPSIVHAVRLWYMPGLEYTHRAMVGMIGISVLMLGVLLPAAAIVREKESGTLEQLLVTPLRPGELIVAKLVPMGLMMLVGLVIGLLEATWLFGTPVRGSLWLFFGVSLLLLFASMGLGAYVGALAHNLLQTLLVTFALLFPMLFLSGTIARIDSMPPPMQLLAYVSPLRYYLPLAEGVLFKGVGLEVLAAGAAGLGAYGLLLMGAGVWQLRRALAG